MSRRLFEQLSSLGRSALRKDPEEWTELWDFIEKMKQTRGWTAHEEEAFFAERFFASCWVRSGQNVYDLTHSMAAMFAITTPPPMDWQHAPHEEFVIKVPRRFLPVDGVIEPDCTYIFASRENTLLIADFDTTAIMQIYYGYNVSRDALEIADASALSHQISETATGLSSDEGRAPMMEWVKRKLPQLSDEERREALERGIQYRQEKLHRVAEEARSLDVKTIGQRVLVNRFVGNVLAYVTEHRPSSRPSAPKTDPNTPRYEILQPPPEVIIDRAFRDAAGAVVSSVMEGSIVGIRRALAHHVRGHWRDQACGAGRSQRKRIWIMPHRRGDESLGSVVRRVEHINIPASLN